MGNGAEMLAQRIVGALLLVDGQTERLAQDRFAQG
jgi:hypothetical protein